MLAIRLQRRGRSGQAQFRLIVQDSRFSPTSGKIVAYLGSYNPHSKELRVDKDKAADYLQKGAQPSDAAARLLAKDGVKLPDWVVPSAPKKRSIKNPDKLRRNRPPGEPAPAKPAAPEAPATEEASETSAPETPPQSAEPAAPEPEAPKDEPAAETETPSETAEETAAETEAPAEEPPKTDEEPTPKKPDSSAA